MVKNREGEKFYVFLFYKHLLIKVLRKNCKLKELIRNSRQKKIKRIKKISFCIVGTHIHITII